MNDFYSADSSPRATANFKLPVVPAGVGVGRWVSATETVQISGVDLPGGMFYVGARLNAPNGDTDPCLISERLAVATSGDYFHREMGCWPSYAVASPNARRAYLTWLSQGRCHPDCDIGYVFLFFYGLERRVVFDSAKDKACKKEWPAIAEELRRLLSIYGEKSASFKRHAGELLSLIELNGRSRRLYEQPVPELRAANGLPPYLRLALGQAAVDRAPVPPLLALAWVRHNPGTHLRTAATRCPDEFECLFVQRYRELLGLGLVLPENRTKLKYVYQPASAGFYGVPVSLSFGGIPDVTALTAPVNTLLDIANQCVDELGPFSRLVGKDESFRCSLHGLVQLPFSLWPSDAKAKLDDLVDQVRNGGLTLTLEALIATLGGAKQPLDRDLVLALARTLNNSQVGIEPHVLAGAKVPEAHDQVVLFAQAETNAQVGSSAEYQTATLTLQLASALAQADGKYCDREISHLRHEIEKWKHLNSAECERLQAHLRWLRIDPPTLAALDRKLEPLEQRGREIVAALMVTLAQSDGFVSPEEVRFLEKIYKAFGVDPKRVFNDLHENDAASSSIRKLETQGFRLDAERIAALQADTARVSALLSRIFDGDVPTPEPPSSSEPEAAEQAPIFLGLDDSHEALLRLLLSRPQWSRAELEDAAADLKLMLDGALEQINEVAFDRYDMPLSEGDDPVDINPELLEKIEA